MTRRRTLSRLGSVGVLYLGLDGALRGSRSGAAAEAGRQALVGRVEIGPPRRDVLAALPTDRIVAALQVLRSALAHHVLLSGLARCQPVMGRVSQRQANAEFRIVNR